MSTPTISLRHATAADDGALRDLAQLDSARVPAGPVLVAEVDGELHAALSLADGAVVADPFVRTTETVELLRAHGAARAARRRHERRVSRRRRPRLALGV